MFAGRLGDRALDMSDAMPIRRLDVRRARFPYRNGSYEDVVVRAGTFTEERIVPPAGEDHAFTFEHWSDRIEISVSPTGRSVQVFYNGVKIPRPKTGRARRPSLVEP
jgi:hypothetical protein